MKCDCGRPFDPVQDQQHLKHESTKLIRLGLEMLGVYFALKFLFIAMGWGGGGGSWVLLWAIWRIAQGLKLRKRIQR